MTGLGTVPALTHKVISLKRSLAEAENELAAIVAANRAQADPRRQTVADVVAPPKRG